MKIAFFYNKFNLTEQKNPKWTKKSDEAEYEEKKKTGKSAVFRNKAEYPDMEA